MDDVQEAVQIEANLTALPDNPTNEEILQAVKGFRNASVPIAMYRLLEAASGGGGGGGSSWRGPVKINAFAYQEIYDTQGTVDGGTYTLTLAGETTAPIAWDASLADVKSALEALPAVGVVTVTSVHDPPTIDGNYDIAFGAMGAPEMLTPDAGGLTGPDAPYTLAAEGLSDVPFEVVTLLAGDVLEDVLVVISEEFNGGVGVYFTDNTGGNPTAPDWGLDNADPFTIPVDSALTFTNFGALAGGKPSSLTAQLENTAILNGAVEIQRFPVVAIEAVTLYAFFDSLPTTPTTGEVWLYASVGQVVAP